jgi:uncharacterized protein
MFNAIRETDNRSIVLSFIVGLALSQVGFGLYPSPIWTILQFIIVVWLIMLRMGKLRPRDIGLRRDHLLEGTIFTVILFVIWQGIEVLTGLAAGSPIVFNPDFTGMANPRQRFPFQEFVISILIFAFIEEIFYRGYLIPQFTKKLHKRFPQQSAWFALIVGLIIIGIIFAATHIVVRLQNGITPAQLLGIGDVGLLSLFLRSLAWSFIYLRTGNLFVATGVHALSNSGPLLFDYTGNRLFGIIYVGLALAAFWPVLRGGWSRLRHGEISKPVNESTILSSETV